jgi:1-deoxy-D-xylulose-5-phosphate reductoisomerase
VDERTIPLPAIGDDTPRRPRDIVVLGSTGSIGTRAVDIIRRATDHFRVVGIAAGGHRLALLAEQALDLGVDVVAVAEPGAAAELDLALRSERRRRGCSPAEARLPGIIAGPDAAATLARWPADTVLNAIVGSVGLVPTLAALEAGRTLVLANKESLVVGGELVTRSARPGQIVPIDSEHSALAQCLRGSPSADVRRMIITASGGPFLGKDRAFIDGVTPEQALAHPTWDMGPVISVNSATMVNKALELIEAHLLFDIPFAQLDVVVHPQSFVHSMVEFVDGSTLAQVGPPDQRSSIAAGLAWPERLPDAAPACDWTRAATWQFLPFDAEEFPVVALAREVGERGGTAPAILNAANEECVAAFLARRLPFRGIVEVIHDVVSERSLSTPVGPGGSLSLADVLDAEEDARRHTRLLIEQRHRLGSPRRTLALGH